MPEWYEATTDVGEVAEWMLKSCTYTDVEKVEPTPWVDWDSVGADLETYPMWKISAGDWELKDASVSPEWLGTLKSSPWLALAHDEQTDLYTTYHHGGLVGPEWNPKPHQCPHCLRHRHPEALSGDVAAMLASHSFDENYKPEEDLSPILCVGSDYEGPPRPSKMGKGSVSYTFTGNFGTSYTLADLNDMKSEKYTFYDEAYNIPAEYTYVNKPLMEIIGGNDESI